METLIEIIWQTALLLVGLVTCAVIVAGGCAAVVAVWEEIRNSFNE